MLYDLVYVFLCRVILTCFIFNRVVTDIGFVECICMYVSLAKPILHKQYVPPLLIYMPFFPLFF